MNEMILKGKWHQTKGAVKEQWGRLTDDDLKVFLGEGEQLVGRLQERYGYSRQQAEREVADFMDGFKQTPSLADMGEKSVETVREHPWFAGVFVTSAALLVITYLVNRFFSGTESRNPESQHRSTA